MAGNGTADQICTQIQSYILASTIVRSAPAHPVSNPLSGLQSICYPAGGKNIQQPPAEKQRTCDIALEISLPFTDTARNYAALAPLVDSVPELLFSQYNTDRFNNLIDTWESIDDEPLHTEEYAPNVLRVVLRFYLRNVKTHRILT